MSRKHIYGTMPFIKFPVDWEIKFMQGATTEMPIYFAIKKEGSPNVVSIAVFAHEELREEDFLWEIAILREHENGTSSIHGYEAMVPLHDVDTLLHFVEKKLTEKISED